MRITDIKAGDTITADAGFTCMRAGHKVVRQDGSGLFVECDDGKHYLDSQSGRDGNLVGLSPGGGG